jgi:diadenosine tetraphosphate (Ap4A) HIT family hydrolase
VRPVGLTLSETRAEASMNPRECPFCSVAQGSIVTQTALTLTLRDAFPVSPGHTLIVPRRHVASLLDATDEEAGEIWRALRLAAADLTGRDTPDGFNVGVNVGAAAGQTVMHLHVHLIPRYAGDQSDPRGGIRLIFPDLADYWSRGFE